jgi:hypothetical protein
MSYLVLALYFETDGAMMLALIDTYFNVLEQEHERSGECDGRGKRRALARDISG